MTNKLAIVLGTLIVALLVANFAFGWEGHLFLARKFVDLTEYLAFWR